MRGSEAGAFSRTSEPPHPNPLPSGEREELRAQYAAGTKDMVANLFCCLAASGTRAAILRCLMQWEDEAALIGQLQEVARLTAGTEIIKRRSTPR